MAGETNPLTAQPTARPPDNQPTSTPPKDTTGAHTTQPVLQQPFSTQSGRQYDTPHTAQPQTHTAQPQTHTSPQRPLPKGAPQPNPRVNLWSHGLCGCLGDVETCCMACFVPCVVFGRNAQAMGRDCFLWGAFLGAGTLLGMPCLPGSLLREEIRRQRGIDGDGCNDCLVWTCCGVCALVQEAQEVRDAKFAQSLQRFFNTQNE